MQCKGVTHCQLGYLCMYFALLKTQLQLDTMLSIPFCELGMDSREGKREMEICGVRR